MKLSGEHKPHPGSVSSEQHQEPHELKSGESIGVTLRRAFSTLFLAGASLTGGGEIQQNHSGGCGCPICLPPERVRLVDRKKEDESGEPE